VKLQFNGAKEHIATFQISVAARENRKASAVMSAFVYEAE